MALPAGPRRSRIPGSGRRGLQALHRRFGWTNPAWAACGGEWVAREDAKLNATWKRLYEASEPNTKKNLLAEQRAWNAFKEKSCRFYGNGDFGREGQVLHFPACRAEVIARRTEALKRYEAGP